MAIYNEPEYNLADMDMRGWAFTHRDNYISPIDAAEKEGVKVRDRSVPVTTNAGTTVEVPVVLSQYSMLPDKKFTKAILKKDGKRIECYMVSGKDPKGVRSVYFTHNDFLNSDGFVELKKEIDTAAKKFRDKHIAHLKSELSKSLAPSAKRAMAELPALLKDGSAADAVRWFKSEGFDLSGMQESDFQPFVDHVKKNGDVTSTFDISVQARWGHQDGVGVRIDFAGKKFVKHGWSSDD
jgi:hypothetical protein